MTALYRHTQIGWVVLVTLAATTAIAVPLARVEGAPEGGFLIAGLLLLAGLVFSTLTVEVDGQAVRIHFTGGLPRRRVLLSDLRACRAVRNPWRYGWGIHMIPGGWIWNVSGFDAVELALADGSLLRVGTDEPEALARAINAVVPASTRDAGPLPMPVVRRRGAGFWITVAAVVAAGVGALVVLFTLQARPPEISITRTTLSVRSLFYGEDYPIAEITAVSLEPRLPRILARTNGFSAEGLLRGWFRVSGLGEGKLFVDVSAPPFVLVRLRRGFVILNFSQPYQTRALYAAIEQSRRP